jgi:hypothetical protein
MGTHIHIREFDDALHAELVRRAKQSELSLTQFLRQELTRIAKSPSFAEVGQNLINLPRDGHVSSWSSQRTARILHESREERDEQLERSWKQTERKRQQ